MRLKKVALAGALFAGFNLANASSLEELVRTLQENGYITQEQAEQILAQEQATTNKDLNQIAKYLKGLKISGKAYLHYDYTIYDLDSSNDDKNAFEITRAYFEVRKYFYDSKKKYFRMTTDVHRDGGSYDVRLKYAYLNWDINKYLQTEIGLAHRPAIDWLEHHIWKHRYMDKTFLEDKYGAHLMNSADLGIAFKGKYQNVGYMFGIYNGEGYHNVENDRHFGKSLEGRINYEIVKGLTLGAHGAFIEHSEDNKADRIVIHPFLVYENPYILVGFQFLYNKENDFKLSDNSTIDLNNYGYVLNTDLKLEKIIGIPLVAFGRYGKWDFDDDYKKYHANGTDYNKKEGIDRYQIEFGLEHTFNKHIKLGLAYKTVRYKEKIEDRKHIDTIMAAMEIKW